MKKEDQSKDKISEMNQGLWYVQPPKKVGGIPSAWSALQHLGKFNDAPALVKAALKMNQKNGFDCPGCAWPDPDDHRSHTGEYCENGLKMLAQENPGNTIGPVFFAHHTVDELLDWNSRDLNNAGRLVHPMIIEEGRIQFAPIEWKDAFRIINDNLNKLSDPNEAAFYASGRTSNEAAFLYGILARGFGTNNLPTCSNLCHDTSHNAMLAQLGHEKTTVKLSDIHQSDLIIIMGLNPGNNHPRMLKALEKCKKNGGKIIAINPLKEAGLLKYSNPKRLTSYVAGSTKIADLYLQIRMNGDMPLLKAMLYLLWQREEAHGLVFDKKFIKQHTEGFESLVEDIKNTDYVDCVRESGVDELDIIKAADAICDRRKLMICWGTGVTQQFNGMQTVHQIINLLLLKGAVGKEGCGPFPVTGHSNVQGIKTMGLDSSKDSYFLKKQGKEFNFEVPPTEGLDALGTLAALDEGKIKAFVSLGGNFVSAVPDTSIAEKALKKCDVSIHLCTKLNRTHLHHGKTTLLLPVLGRSEIDIQKSGYQFVTTENATNTVQNSKGILPPKSDYLKSEIAIICEIGKRLFEGYTLNLDWERMMNDYDQIRNKIQNLVPGFANFNAKIRDTKGFYLPNPVRSNVYMTSVSKAIFMVNDLPDNKLKYNQFHLGSIRSQGQFNTSIHTLNDRYRSVFKGRSIVFMNEMDMNEFEFKPKDKVNIYSNYNGKMRSVLNFQIIPYDIPRRNLMAYFPEINPLFPGDHKAQGVSVPAFKNIIVELERVIETNTSNHH